jgi:monooxygenase
MTQPEHLDVLIAGAGLSGIGAACHLVRESPGRSYAVLEARAASGGTWDLFRYPGIRSDSDMFTLGYGFRPWRGAKSIADGGSILAYLRDTAAEFGVDEKIRYHHRVTAASWSSEQARWTVDVERTDTGETLQLTCNFLFGNTGYYSYEQGYTPRFPGLERYQGTVVHPQEWPAGLDYAGRRVLVIGSGATAVTLVPALAGTAGHVTMLQRSPSYVIPLPSRDPLTATMERRLPARVAAPLIRWRFITVASLSYQLSRRRPEVMKRMIRKVQTRMLPAGYPVETHFAPSYQPWDQRLCIVPDGDLFRAIRKGTAEVVTDTIDTFTASGVKLASGREIEADVVVTATGLNLKLLGGIDLAVDGVKVDLSQSVGYKGMMFSGVPNLAATIGYTNASWTLKADLVAGYVTRLLNFMAEHGYRQVEPQAPAGDRPTHPFIDLSSGYVLRSLDALPKQGDKAPWRLHQNYWRDLLLLRFGRVQDGVLEFSNPTPARVPA